MITEYFWVYVSGMLRDHEGPETGRRLEHLTHSSTMITEYFWVYVSEILRDHEGPGVYADDLADPAVLRASDAG
ncbi:MAG: hypothetical protein QOJ73_6294 [Streptosporangiaceae bacterium]|jgi:hypothetical protein|nr:hypothetical protein [Streptosporangiaceae bacterium]